MKCEVEPRTIWMWAAFEIAHRLQNVTLISILCVQFDRDSLARVCVRWFWPSAKSTKTITANGERDSRMRPCRWTIAKTNWVPSTMKSNANWNWWVWQRLKINYRTECSMPYLIYKWPASKYGYWPETKKVKVDRFAWRPALIYGWSLAETAVNIGYSCQLLTDDLIDLFVVDGATSDEVEKQLIKYQDAIKEANSFKPPSMAVSHLI